ncbi:MAG: VWA domain-containing protein [Cyanothece sp. SIO2G6]|nr:VWA domain-containing protein [Cyanothece sp. SIO2G6]
MPETEPSTPCLAYHPSSTVAPQQLRRWRLILGHEGNLSVGAMPWTERDEAIDQALSMLYDQARSHQTQGGDRSASLQESAPTVARWLGDIRTYFPASVVQVMQRDALERFDWYSWLTEPDVLDWIEPDVHFVANLLALRSVMPAPAKAAARQLVQKLVSELLEKLMMPLQQAVRGSLHRASQTRRPRHTAINWSRTIRANLRHYQPDYGTIIPEVRLGYGHQRSTLKHVILCVDQSGSMLPSVIYASIFAAVLASMPALTTTLVLFDTAVVDLSDRLHDPVDLLWGTQLGGGTDIHRALNYCHSLVQQPEETLLILISDLYEGGSESNLIKQMGAIGAAGVQAIALLALSDSGAPSFHQTIASQFANLDIPTFGCTPDQFPDLMATAINRGDIHQWAAAQHIEVVG